MGKKKKGTSLAVQWLKLCLLMQGVWVWSLFGELSSHIPCGQKTNKKTRNIRQKQQIQQRLKNGPLQKKSLKKRKSKGYVGDTVSTKITVIVTEIGAIYVQKMGKLLFTYL